MYSVTICCVNLLLKQLQITDLYWTSVVEYSKQSTTKRASLEVKKEIIKTFYKNCKDVYRNGIKRTETSKGCYTVET